MSEQAQQCAICARPAKSRCSKCKKWSFCGLSSCTELAWPVHRQSCRNPAPTAFILPALRKDYVQHLSVESESTEVVYDPTGERTDWFQYVKRRGWYSGTKAQLLADLLLKPLSCPIPEPTRSFILLAASRPLTNPEVADSPANAGTDWWSPWYLVGQDFFAVEQVANKDGRRLPDDIFEELNAFLTQSVIFHALSLDDGKVEDALEGDTMQSYRWLAIERMTGLARTANVEPGVKAHLLRMVENCRMVVQFYD